MTISSWGEVISGGLLLARKERFVAGPARFSFHLDGSLASLGQKGGRTVARRTSVAMTCILAAFGAGCSNRNAWDGASLTKPAGDAFAKLASWRPWQSASEDPAPAPSEHPAPVLVESKPLAPPTLATVEARPMPVSKPVAQRQAKRPAPPIVLPTAMTRPGVGLATPTAVRCQTNSAPGERVRMECLPID